MMNHDPKNPEPDEGPDIYSQEYRDRVRAAKTRITNILSTTPHLLDDKGYIRSTNDILDDAQTFLRNNLDLAYDTETGDWGTDAHNIGGYEHLTRELAAGIISDLRIIWADQFSRDDISNWAIQMSLCPMHFCDWAACFDDDDDECAAIRTIYPHSHDT